MNRLAFLLKYACNLVNEILIFDLEVLDINLKASLSEFEDHKRSRRPLNMSAVVESPTANSHSLFSNQSLFHQTYSGSVTFHKG